MMYHVDFICNNNNLIKTSKGKWVKARPINYQCRTLLEKLKDAYYVFIGKADAIIWEDQ